MASYRLSDRALADLERLYERGVLNFGLRLADEYYDGLTARMQGIADHPELYPAVDYIRKGYRRSVYGVDSIYYRIEAQGVEIVRVLGRQDSARSL
ncbi:MAG: type II toxin-antitoxin system RelE/ParE family toxin [Proteobacteria bacterium]|nr:type II toxin-antitoxin system RelE/ParE family toxin [Pseudomonadota bacterium]